MSGERLVSDEQIDILVEQRMVERRKVVEEVVAALQPQLEGIRAEASNANHIKETLGRQLTRVERSLTRNTTTLEQTIAELRAHVDLPFHPKGSDTIRKFTEMNEKGLGLLEDFGVTELSLEEKQALGPMLASHVVEQKEHVAADRRADRRQLKSQIISTLISNLTGAIVAIGAVLGILKATGVIK